MYEREFGRRRPFGPCWLSKVAAPRGDAAMPAPAGSNGAPPAPATNAPMRPTVLEAGTATAPGAATGTGTAAARLGLHERGKQVAMAGGKQAAIAGRKAAGKAAQATGKAYELATTEEQRRQHKEKFRQQARAVALPAAELVMGVTGSKLKLLLTNDADMPGSVARTIESMVDSLWPDVQRQVLVELEKALAPAPLAAAGEAAAATVGCCTGLFRRVRGAVLHAYKPYDASIFGQLRRPGSVLCLLLAMCPWFGVRAAFFVFVLLLISAGGSPFDEHQLIAFILHFKATQSLAGVLFFAQGHVMYYACLQLLPPAGSAADAPGGHSCVDNGPGAHRMFVMDMLGLLAYVTLAWLAWALLAYARPFEHGAGAADGAAGSKTLVRDHSQMSRDDRARARDRRLRYGSRLRSLLRYDTVAFLVCGLLCVLLEMLTEDWDAVAASGESFVTSWRFKATFFLCRSIYALSSVPFLPLALPIVREILTQSAQPTGFDRDGIVRAMAIPPRPPPAAPMPAAQALQAGTATPAGAGAVGARV